MRFRNFDADGDWLFGNGRACFAIDNDAILLNISTTLKTFLGECFFDSTIGVDWFTLINQKNKDVIVLAVKNAIYNCIGVLEVKEVEYTFDENREMVITYNITTVYQTDIWGTVTI